MCWRATIRSTTRAVPGRETAFCVGTSKSLELPSHECQARWGPPANGQFLTVLRWSASGPGCNAIGTRPGGQAKTSIPNGCYHRLVRRVKNLVPAARIAGLTATAAVVPTIFGLGVHPFSFGLQWFSAKSQNSMVELLLPAERLPIAQACLVVW